MNPKSNLILLKGEDKTDKIKWCEYKNRFYCVTFINGSEPFSYAANNVEWFREPSQLSIENKFIYKDGKLINGIDSLLQFERYIKIFYTNGYNEFVRENELIILESIHLSPQSKSVLEYFKSLSKKISLKTDEGKALMAAKYEKLEFIHPESCLAKYLEPDSLKNNERETEILIYPFGCNLSQKSAVDRAMRNKISVIEGPPGTGKTQTILNIIANIILQNKTVAVVSNNNSATDNVFEKLEKLDLDFFAARLGNSENKKAFIENQCNARVDMPVIEKEQRESLMNSIRSILATMDEYLNMQNDIAKMRVLRSELLTEQKYFLEYFDETYDIKQMHRLKKQLSSENLLVMWIKYESFKRDGKKETLPFFEKLMNIVKYGFRNREFFMIPIEKIIPMLQKKYYESELVELERDIEAGLTKIDKYDLKEQLRTLTEDSMKLFQASLGERFTNKGRHTFSIDELWKDPYRFLHQFPLILSTTFSITSSLNANVIYDYVIVDEASQVDLLTGNLALSCAKNSIIVGDLMQLPNVINNKDKIIIEEVSKHYLIPEKYRFEKNSLLSSIISVFNDVEKTMLIEHYRCHPKIIQFCNQKFYNNELIILTEDNNETDTLKVYKTVQGNHSRGRINQRQIDEIIETIIPDLGDSVSREDIGIIAPYRDQKNRLVSELTDTSIEVDTVHKYQGREKDHIIITTVDNVISGFIDDPNLLNVAISRAKKSLRIVVSDNEKNLDTNIGDLIRYVQHNNFEVINGKIYSIFDLLYKEYSQKRIQYLKKSKKISQYDSENIAYQLILEILEQKDYNSLLIASHFPLNMVIRDLSLLTDEEIKYIMNINTHVDFLIYRRYDKSPILAIEVDGFAFHIEGTKQSERDLLKDSILCKYGLSILRLSTIGSGEREKIMKALDEVLR